MLNTVPVRVQYIYIYIYINICVCVSLSVPLFEKALIPRNTTYGQFIRESVPRDDRSDR